MSCVSDPGLPALPGPAKDVGVSSMVDETGHLVLHTEATPTAASPLTVAPVPQEDVLQMGELWCALVTQLQLCPAGQGEASS